VGANAQGHASRAQSSTAVRANINRPQKPFAIATAMYREIGMTYWLEKANRELKELM
jgi:hypothetical protein